MENLCDLSSYLKVVSHPNGGATTLHLDYSEVSSLSVLELNQLASLFYSQIYSNDSNHVMGIIHNSVSEHPDFLSFLCQRYPHLQVKVTLLNSREVRTMPITEYFSKVTETYSHGTFMYGNLNQLSLVGCVDEEAGGYLTDILDVLTSNIFIKNSLPWGDLSAKTMRHPWNSNDGPILWTRAGEQSILLSDNVSGKRARKTPKNLHSYRRSEPREVFVPDRTYCHLDFSHNSFRDSTAAAGVLKAVHCGNTKLSRCSTEVKHVICFHPQDMKSVCDILRLDIFEPPATQCIQWVDIGKLNYLRRQGIRYSRITLFDNDAYFIPKNVVHQFTTVSACTSIAWHVSMENFESLFISENAKSKDSSDEVIDPFYQRTSVSGPLTPGKLCHQELHHFSNPIKLHSERSSLKVAGEIVAVQADAEMSVCSNSSVNKSLSSEIANPNSQKKGEEARNHVFVTSSGLISQKLQNIDKELPTDSPSDNIEIVEL